MRSQLTQRGSPDGESEMLPQNPPPWVIRSTAWILLAAFLFALLIATVMPLPATLLIRPNSRHGRGSNPITGASYHQPRGRGRRSTCESGRRIVRLAFR